MEPKPDIWALRSETNRIMMAHRCHLLTPSTLFLLPLSSLYVIYPTLSFQLLNHFYSHQPQPINLNPLFFHLLYSLFVMFFSFCGVSSITNSVFHAFYDQPFNVVSSIKSISTSFFPLLATTIVLKLIFFFISLFFALLFFLLILGTQLLGITPSPYYFLGFSAAVLFVLPMLFVVIHLQVRWTLVPVIVVLESCWGLEALRRSASLIKGMKKVALTLLLFFGLMEGLCIWSIPVMNLSLMGSPNGKGTRTFDWVNILLEIVGKSLLIMIYLFYNTVVNTVLYIFCKEGIHANEYGKEYVSLPLDDKV